MCYENNKSNSLHKFAAETRELEQEVTRNETCEYMIREKHPNDLINLLGYNARDQACKCCLQLIYNSYLLPICKAR